MITESDRWRQYNSLEMQLWDVTSLKCTALGIFDMRWVGVGVCGGDHARNKHRWITQNKKEYSPFVSALFKSSAWALLMGNIVSCLIGCGGHRRFSHWQQPNNAAVRGQVKIPACASRDMKMLRNDLSHCATVSAVPTRRITIRTSRPHFP